MHIFIKNNFILTIWSNVLYLSKMRKCPGHFYYNFYLIQDCTTVCLDIKWHIVHKVLGSVLRPGMLIHSLINISCSWCREIGRGSKWWMCCSSSSQTCSTRLQFGDCGGHSRYQKMICKQFWYSGWVHFHLETSHQGVSAAMLSGLDLLWCLIKQRNLFSFPE